MIEKGSDIEDRTDGMHSDSPWRKARLVSEPEHENFPADTPTPAPRDQGTSCQACYQGIELTFPCSHAPGVGTDRDKSERTRMPTISMFYGILITLLSRAPARLRGGSPIGGAPAP